MVSWRKSNSDEHNMVSLGYGTFVAPLPAGWRFEPGPPLSGSFVWPRGERLAYSLDCHEDAAAAAGTWRLLDFANEEGYGTAAETPEAVLDDILVLVPAGDESDTREIVWKWLEPFEGIYVRELRLSLDPGPTVDVNKRLHWAREVGEWLRHGRFADEQTILDTLANSQAMKRVCFGGNVLMRVPRDWAVKPIENDDLPGDGWYVEPPDEAETLWVRFIAKPMPGDPDDWFDAQVAVITDYMGKHDWGRFDPPGMVREALDDYDLLFVGTREEEDEHGPLRRTTYRRNVYGEGYFMTALVHLCTDLARIGEPRFVESAAAIDREVRRAAIIPPRG